MARNQGDLDARLQQLRRVYPNEIIGCQGSGAPVHCAVHCRAPFPIVDALFPQAGRVFAMRQHLTLL
jgi:hypothetical protein